MTDRSCAIGPLVSSVLWATGMALLVFGSIEHDMIMAFWCLPGFAGGAVACIRCFFVRQTQAMREVYEMGREVGRLDLVPRPPSRPRTPSPLN